MECPFAWNADRWLSRCARLTLGIQRRWASDSTSPIAWGMMSNPANQNGAVAKTARIPIFPETETRFLLKEVDAQLTFVFGRDGQAREVILEQGAQEMTGKRLD